MTEILSAENLTKSYKNGATMLTVLHDISLIIPAGASCAIVGPSGSGKTTLLGLCAGLDLPTSGGVILNSIALNGLSEDERAAVRNQQVGFVFQNFQLMPTLTAVENVMVPLELRGDNGAHHRARELLQQVGLSERLNHYPVQLSGGEQQRVALARAFVNRPRILFADEPTGNLDSETSERIEDILFQLNAEHGTTLVIATHDLELAARTQRIIKLKAGAVVSDHSTNHVPAPQPAHS
ncbi:MAG TPA: ABC transporter ATP-binding protein [bacterium]